MENGECKAIEKKNVEKAGVTCVNCRFAVWLANTIRCGQGECQRVGEGLDYTKVPKLLITELVPDSSNVAGSDAYEFIEVYNNSSRPVSLKDYSLDYHYLNASGSDVDAVWSLTSLADNPVIPSKQSVVLWVMNSVNTGLTAADFNGNYGTSLVEGGNLFRVSGGNGMHNSAVRDFS